MLVVFSGVGLACSMLMALAVPLLICSSIRI
jgi:hypothetical protein